MLILWNQGYLFHCFVFLHIESLFVFPCQWNYRPDHCIYGSNCQEAEEEGIFVLHGNRGVYHDDKQPAFRAIYEALRNVSIFLKSFQWKYFQTYREFARIVQRIFIFFTLIHQLLTFYSIALSLVLFLYMLFFSHPFEYELNTSCSFTPKNFCVFSLKTRTFSYQVQYRYQTQEM